MLKLLVISFSFQKGGAAIAANNFCKLIETNLNIDLERISQDEFQFPHFLKRLVSFSLSKLQYSTNPIKHSLNLFTFKPVLKAIDKYQKSIFHFHWITNDTLSVFDFHRIPPYSIITLHDEWLYLGTEHYHDPNDISEDFILGYKPRKKSIIGIHWNYLIWKKKYASLSKRKDLIFTVPSNWMRDRAKSSLILRNSEIRVLPNPIDTDVFIPSKNDQIRSFRKSCGIDEDVIVIAFGAMDGKKNPIKGFCLLEEALELLPGILPAELFNKLVILTFGGKKERKNHQNGLLEISLGHIAIQEKIALLYSSSDILVVPSLLESFGQVAAEALACQTPVVCFDTSGLKDIVVHRESGMVAPEKSASSLSKSLVDMISLSYSERLEMGKNGRLKVMEKFSKSVVGINYLELVLEQGRLKKTF